MPLAKEPVEHNHLPDWCYIPGNTTTMTRKQLRETLLATAGKCMAQGRMCDVTSKHLGAGVYRVWLQPSA